MDKAEFLFEKIAKKELSPSDYKEYKEVETEPSGYVLSRLVPFIGGYLGTPQKLRKGHPVASTLLGPAGAQGARAKNTGKSELTEAATLSASVGAGVGAVAGAMRGSMLGGGNSKALPYFIAGGLAGAAGGGLGGAISYGLGHLTGRKVKEK